MLTDNTNGQLTEEANIPHIFNEIDPNGDPESSWIRNIVNFKLYNDDMQPIQFSDLGEGMPTATLIGEIIVPLSPNLKQKIVESACAVAQQLIPDSFIAVAAGSTSISSTAIALKPPTLVPWFDTELFYENVRQPKSTDFIYYLFFINFCHLYSIIS
jgi:hypothetical protein